MLEVAWFRLLLIGGDPGLGKLPYYYKCLVNYNKHKEQFSCLRRRKCVSNQNACGASRDASKRFYITLKQTLEDIVAQEALKPTTSLSTRFKTMTHPQANKAGSVSHVRVQPQMRLRKLNCDCHLIVGHVTKKWAYQCVGTWWTITFLFRRG